MRLNSFILIISIMSCVLGFDHSPASGTDYHNLVEKLVRISGLRNQLQQFPNAFLMTIPKDLFQENRIQLVFITQMKKKIDADKLVDLFEEAFLQNQDPEKLDLTTEFYESSLGRKVGRINGEALSGYNLKAIREARKVATTLTENRFKLLERIIAGQHIVSNNSAFRTLIAEILNRHQPGVIGKDHGKFLQGSTDSIRESIFTCFAYTYRSLSDTELQGLAEFGESSAGFWFHNNMTEGFKKIIAKTAQEFNEELQNLGNLSGIRR